MLLKMVEENVDATLTKNKYEKSKNNNILKSLKNILNLKNLPKKIEIYDNSHLNGSNPVGAMVVFENGAFLKKCL